MRILGGADPIANAPAEYRVAMRPDRVRTLAAGLLMVLAASCASDPSGDPRSALDDPASTTPQQVQAVRSIAADLTAGRVEPADGREALKRIVWRRSAPTPVRVAALEALLDHDPDDTAVMLGLMLPTETNWDLIARIGDLASERGWTALTPALVRSWARPVVEPADGDRPERAALAALHPAEPIERVVFRVFAAPEESGVDDRTRSAAWALLQRLDTDGSITRRLLAAPADGDEPAHGMIADLRAGARDLGVVPRTAEQLNWLRRMRQPEHAGFWREASALVARLDEPRARGLALRHIPALVWAGRHEPSWLTASREEHLAALRSALDGRRRHRRTDGVDDFNRDRETLDAWEDALAWGDLLLVRMADRAIADRGVAGALFEQARRDRADTTTEHGGVIDEAGAGFLARPFPPRPTQRVGDNRFVASAEMLAASTQSLFHYHFHAQRRRNTEYAGPGRGDLAYADRFGRACLVFTTVSDAALNADVYFPGGARIDLGEIRRPSG
ncbi:MAG: hypothetical protein D6693_10945 [Planctomycetota bacterium]|nr:MAG: hypothetical protein D6693_10945 [Planctomycetota bacterium]